MQTPPTDPNTQTPPDPQPVAPPQQAYQFAPPATSALTNMLVGRFVGLLIDGLISSPLYWMAFIPLVNFVGAPLLTAYWLCRDIFLGNQSIGKRVMGLQVICDDGAPFTFAKSALRNITYLPLILYIVPILSWFVVGPLMLILGLIEVIMVVTTGRRLGDNLAGTRVVPANR